MIEHVPSQAITSIVPSDAVVAEINRTPAPYDWAKEPMSTEEWQEAFYLAKLRAFSAPPNITNFFSETPSELVLIEVQEALDATARERKATRLAAAFARMSGAMDDTSTEIDLSDLRLL